MRNYRNSSWLQVILALIFIVFGILGGVYVGAYLMFIKPILDCARAFDDGTLTGMIIAITVLKCVFASFVGYIVALIGVTLSKIVLK